MPTLIRWRDGGAEAAEDRFVQVADDEPIPSGPVILSWSRFQAEGAALTRAAADLGVRLEPQDEPEALADVLPRLGLIALTFPNFRDGRAYSAARILRERLGWRGELRAVGEVLRDQARSMARCGFDAFEPVDGSTPEVWTDKVLGLANVYQRGADDRAPAFVQRGEARHGV